ncbi:17820_t:CDS:1, partial [Gigaspora rosea]
LQLRLRKEKNNQCGVFYRQRYGHTNTRSIPIPADNSGNQFKPVKDILVYLSKRPSKCKPADALFLKCVRKQS